jgi:hypothetical protein
MFDYWYYKAYRRWIAIKIYGGKDYYDCALSMGIDPTITLLRGKSNSVAVEKAGGTLLNRYLEEKSRNAWPEKNFRCVAVAFCTKVYRGALINGFQKDEGIWSADRMRDWARKKKNREVVVYNNWRDEKMTLDEWFTPYDAPDALRNYMIANKISILVEEPPEYGHEPKEFQVNPFTLKRLGFAKALDPYSAFQELSMWIGGVLGGTSPEIVTIKDDKTLIEGHGFDNRFSFRGPRIA